MLTDTAIKALKPQQKLYKVSDRDGMYVGARDDFRGNSKRSGVAFGC